jgi:hypothetical protein
VRDALLKADRARSPVLRERALVEMQKLPEGATPRDLLLLVRSLRETSS